MSTLSGFLGGMTDLLRLNDILGNEASTILVVAGVLCTIAIAFWCSTCGSFHFKDGISSANELILNPTTVQPVLESIRKRRSVFPRDYIDGEVPSTVVESMLNAASWAPFHGPTAPWRFVVLGKKAMVEMQVYTHLTPYLTPL